MIEAIPAQFERPSAQENVLSHISINKLKRLYDTLSEWQIKSELENTNWVKRVLCESITFLMALELIEGDRFDLIENRIQVMFPDLDTQSREILHQLAISVKNQDPKVLEMLQSEVVIALRIFSKNENFNLELAHKLYDASELEIDHVKRQVLQNMAPLFFGSTLVSAVSISLLAQQFGSHFWNNGSAYAFVQYAAVTVVVIAGLHKKKSHKVRSETEKIRRASELQAKNRGLQDVRPFPVDDWADDENLKVSAHDIDTLQHIQDPALFDDVARLSESLSSSDNPSADVLPYIGFIPQEEIVRMNTFLKYYSSSQPSMITRFANRCVRLSQIYFSSYINTSTVVKLDTALEQSPSGKRFFKNRQPYSAAMKNLAPHASRDFYNQTHLQIEEYLQLKMRYLSASDDNEAKRLETLISENLSRLAKQLNKDNKGISRRKFLQYGAVAGTGIMAAKSLAANSDVQRILGAANSRDTLDFQEETLNPVEVFERFIQSYEHPYLSEISPLEAKARMRDLLPQAILFWKDGTASFEAHLTVYFNALFDQGQQFQLQPRALLYFFRIGAQNTFSIETQNADVETAKLQTYLSNAIQAARETDTYELTKDLISSAILVRARIFDAPRTVQDVTMGIHDMELSILARIIAGYGDFIGGDTRTLQAAERLSTVRNECESLKVQIQELVFHRLLPSVLDPGPIVEKLLDDDFLNKLGIGQEVSPSQLTSYTWPWALSTLSTDGSLTHENLAKISHLWKTEYRSMTDPKDALYQLILDQGKFLSFWNEVKDQELFDRVIVQQVIEMFLQYSHKISEIVAARDELNECIGPREYDMEFQMPLGCGVVKEYADKIRDIMDSEPLYGNLQTDDREKMSIFLMISIREIGVYEHLVRAENQFPQDVVEALPYNHERALSSIVEFIGRMRSENLLQDAYTWDDFHQAMHQVRAGQAGSRELQQFYSRQVSGISHIRALEAARDISAF